MSFIFSTVAEYNEEITFVQGQLRKAMTAEDWSLNTSQSSQRVKKNIKEMRGYLRQLTGERSALGQRQAGAGVTSIVFRRNN